MRKPAVQSRLAVFDEAQDRARRVEKQVRVLSSVIADIMAETHGEPFRVDIDHEAGFVMVRRV